MQAQSEKKERKTAVVYVRQSFGNNDESVSCDVQKANCIKWAEAHNIEVIGVYEDKNTSSELYPDSEEGKAFALTDREWCRWNAQQKTKGRKKFRSGLASAFEQLEKIDFFIVNESTRFFRNPSPLSTLDTYCLGKLKENNVALVEVETNKIDYIDNSIDLAVRRLLATYEMQKLTERKQASIKSRNAQIAKGIVFSKGYGVIWKDKKIYFDEDKAEVVKVIFQSIIQGKTIGAILTILNTKFLKYSNGKSFYESTIYNIISNPIYSGVKIKDNQIIKAVNIVEPIITFAEWQEANKIIADRKARGGRQSRKENYNFLPLSGMLYCGNCGKKLTVINDRGVIYNCHNSALLHDSECAKIRLRTFIDYDDNDFYTAIQPLLMISLYNWYFEIESRKANVKSIEALKIELASIEAKIKKIVNVFTSNGISDDVFESQIQILSNKKKEIEKQIIAQESQSAAQDEELIKLINQMKMEIGNEIERKLIDEDSFSILVRRTIKKMIVFRDKIEVVLFDNNKFTIERKQVDRRGRLIIDYATVTNYVVNGFVKPCIKFGKGENKLNTATYTILY